MKKIKFVVLSLVLVASLQISTINCFARSGINLRGGTVNANTTASHYGTVALEKMGLFEGETYKLVFREEVFEENIIDGSMSVAGFKDVSGTWKSSDTSVVKISKKKGKKITVTAVSPGEADVTVTRKVKKSDGSTVKETSTVHFIVEHKMTQEEIDYENEHMYDIWL